MPTEPDSGVDPAGQALVAGELRRYRERAGLSRNELATRVGYSRTYISTCEKPGAALVSAAVVKRIDEELGAGGALVAVHASVEADRRSRRAPPHGVAEPAADAAHPDRPLAPALQPGREAAMSISVVDVLGPSHALSALAKVTQTVIDRYEWEGPHRLFREVQALYRLSGDLGGRVTGSTERQQLVRVSARQTALLAYMSVNLARFEDAERYGWEAAMLSTAAGDRDLLAWVKGTQSFCAYYQHRYEDALNLARVGVHLAVSDGQRIRLLANGVARAAGKLGDRAMVDRAVDAAFGMLEPDSPAGMTACIDFAPYGPTRVTANAATAYLSVGAHAQALRLTDQLGQTVAESDSDWSRSLVGLDTATALALVEDADLDHAVAVGIDALAAGAHNPITSIHRRAAELAAHLRRRDPGRAGQEFEEALSVWTRSGPPE